MKTIKIRVKLNKMRGVYQVVVNGQILSERPHPKYADEKAQAFAECAKASGVNVELILVGKAA